MRICLTSDIHHPRSGVLPGKLVELICKAKADVFAIAGDLSDGVTQHFRECLSYFDSIETPKCIVLGNHDLWLRDGWGRSRNSEKKLEKLLDIAHDAGFHPLWRSPLVLEDVALVGNIGWYDYRFRSLPLPTRIYERKMHLGYMWNDANYIRWRYSDLEFNEICLNRLEAHLTDIQAKDDIRSIFVITHHVPFEACVLRKGIQTFDFFNAYMGSPLTGELISRYGKVRSVAFGHSHGKGIPTQREYKLGRVTAYNIAVDFDDPKPFTLVA